MTIRGIATFFYTIAVRAFPRGHRADYADEMIDAFNRELTAQRNAHGRVRALRFVVAAWLDAVSAGLGERRRYRRSAASRVFADQGQNHRRGAAVRLGMSWLDVKLGIRMLVRYPGLSLVGGLGIALVIVCGTVAGVFDAVINGTLPFEEGDRVVAIENWDTSQNTPAPHDFLTWRDQLKTVQDVGAYRLVSRNVATAELHAEPVRMAEISAAAFTVARVPPLLGRYLVPEDEHQSAPPVILIGHDEWQRRFAGDPQIVGRTIQVGDTASTLVGVMPKGFGFPVNERYWIPLRLNAADYARGQAPSNMPFKSMPQGVIHVFGRLAPGADVTAAQAELAVIGQRAAVESPGTHARLRPRVYPYTRWFFLEQHDGEIFLVQGLLALLLGIVGANVAVLVYARTATRQIEIALRSALGASRLRIVGQMFAEGLVLSGAAAAAGLMIAVFARRQLDSTVTWEQAPFWVNTSVTSGTAIGYVLGLAVLGAVVVGVIPALQATGRRAQTGLQHAAASSSGWRIGRTYGVLIVVQVALAVAILPFAVSSSWTSIRDAAGGPGFPAHEFLTARVAMETEVAERFQQRKAVLTRQLEAEPGVSDVIFLTGAPGAEPAGWVQVEGDKWRELGIGRVGVDFFKVFDIAILAGRPFDARDLDVASRHVIVNRTFAQNVIRGNPIGRRVRQAGSSESTPGPWLEIAGVVENFPARATTPKLADARLYYPVPLGDTRFSLLALRVRGGAPTSLAGRLREITTTLDHGLLLRDIRSLDALLQDQKISARLGAWAAGLATLSLLLLSATGLYALMSFTVTQRRREIGIRVALGANPRTIVRNILSRALWQLTAGVAVGVAIAAALNDGTAGEFTGGAGLAMLPAVAAFVLLVGLIAAAGPARRGLRIQPTDALKEP